MSTNKWERQKERKNEYDRKDGKWRRRREQDLKQGYILKKGKKGKVQWRLANKMCVRAHTRGRERIELPKDKTDFILTIFSELLFHKSENILWGRYFSIVGNKTQNAFETAPTVHPRTLSEHLARSERERQFLDAMRQP